LFGWSIDELNVPEYPARRVYRGIARRLSRLPGDVILDIEERPHWQTGETAHHPGEPRRPLTVDKGAGGPPAPGQSRRAARTTERTPTLILQVDDFAAVVGDQSVDLQQGN